jgi:hypothetical protein
MVQYKTFEEALAAQVVDGGYDNSFNGWPSGNPLIGKIPFAIKPVLWVIMANDYYLGDYEEGATEYGIDASGRWWAMYDGHCSCYGWESTIDHATHYDTLDDLLRADPRAKVIQEKWGDLTSLFPFLR